jgi:beta-galactosidase
MAMPGFNYYQWMLCDTTGYTTIPNANSNVFTPTNTGSYAVLIINGTCTVITDCLSFTSPFGLNEENTPSFYCYPNPNTGRKLFFSVSDVEVSITDLSGRVLLEKQRIDQTSSSLDLSELPAGVYLVQAEHSGEQLTSTIILQ